MALWDAMTAWGLKDTSSRPAIDLGGGTLRRTIRTVLRSYDSRASGDLLLYRSIGLIMPIFERDEKSADFNQLDYHRQAGDRALVFNVGKIPGINVHLFG